MRDARAAMAPRRPMLGWLALLCWLLIGCGQKPAPAVPAPPKPPTDPWSWVPEQSSIVGRVVLDRLRGTPLWPVWTEIERQQRISSWVDLAKVETVTFGGTGQTAEETSYIAALEGRFGEAELRELAARDGLTPEQHGLLTLYRRPDGVWTQVTSRLIVTATVDRLDALVARAGAGDGIPVRATPLYASLADRVSLTRAHLGMIAEDPEGKGRATLDRRASRYGLGQAVRDSKRAGIALETGGTYRLVAVSEAEDPARAQAVEAEVRGALDDLGRNFLVRMLGVGPLLAQLKTAQDGSYVYLRGQVGEAEVNRVVQRLTGALDLANSVGIPAGGL